MTKYIILFLATINMAFAQQYPSQPIKVSVPFQSGVALEGRLRAIFQQLENQVGQPIVIENRPSGSSAVAAAHVGASKPDGYTLLVTDDDFLISSYDTNKKSQHDMSNFVTVAGLLKTKGAAVLVSANSPINNIQDLVKYARENPYKVSYATNGENGIYHLTTANFAQANKLQLTHVPYKSTLAGIFDVMSGQVTMSTTSVAQALPLIKDGRVKAIAVTTDVRSPELPNVPTVKEQGSPEWNPRFHIFLLAPSGTPQEVVDKLSQEISKLQNNQEFVKREILDFNYLPFAVTAQGLNSHITNFKNEFFRITKALRQ